MGFFIFASLILALGGLLAVYLANLRDADRIAAIAKELDDHRKRSRQAAMERHRAEQAQPIPWVPPADHLDLAKLEVTHEAAEL